MISQAPPPVTLYGRCGSWMAEEWRMCAAGLKPDGNRQNNRHDLVLSGGEFFAQRYEQPSALSAYGGRCDLWDNSPRSMR